MNDNVKAPDPAKLAEWYQIQAQLGPLKEKEQQLRQEIFGSFFPSPVEGTNNFQMADGYVLKGKHSINRSVDEAGLVALAPELEKRHIIVGSLVKRKPELVLSAYRTLTEDDRRFFDQTLIIKPGMPALEIVKPKRGRGGA